MKIQGTAPLDFHTWYKYSRERQKVLFFVFAIFSVFCCFSVTPPPPEEAQYCYFSDFFAIFRSFLLFFGLFPLAPPPPGNFSADALVHSILYFSTSSFNIVFAAACCYLRLLMMTSLYAAVRCLN